MSDKFGNFIKDNALETEPANQEHFKTVHKKVLAEHRRQRALKTTAFSLFFAALFFNFFFLFQQPIESHLTDSDHDYLEELFAFEDETLSDDEDVLLWEVSL